MWMRTSMPAIRAILMDQRIKGLRGSDGCFCYSIGSDPFDGPVEELVFIADCFSRFSWLARLLLLERRGLEEEFAFLELDRHAAVVAHVAGQDLARQRRLNMPLEEALERPGAIDRVVALEGDVFLGGVAQFQFNVAFGEPGAQQLELQLDDAFDFGKRQRLEEDEFVRAIEEFRPEMGA